MNTTSSFMHSASNDPSLPQNFAEDVAITNNTTVAVKNIRIRKTYIKQHISSVIFTVKQKKTDR